MDIQTGGGNCSDNRVDSSSSSTSSEITKVTFTQGQTIKNEVAHSMTSSSVSSKKGLKVRFVEDLKIVGGSGAERKKLRLEKEILPDASHPARLPSEQLLVSSAAVHRHHHAKLILNSCKRNESPEFRPILCARETCASVMFKAIGHDEHYMCSQECIDLVYPREIRRLWQRLRALEKENGDLKAVAHSRSVLDEDWAKELTETCSVLERHGGTTLTTEVRRLEGILNILQAPVGQLQEGSVLPAPSETGEGSDAPASGSAGGDLENSGDDSTGKGTP